MLDEPLYTESQQMLTNTLAGRRVERERWMTKGHRDAAGGDGTVCCLNCGVGQRHSHADQF